MNTTKIILINTNLSNNGFYCYPFGIEGSWINHGLASIGAYLQYKQIPFEYIDLRKLCGWKDFRKRISCIDKGGQQIFGISATTVDYGNAVKAAKIIKKKYPTATVVFGGIHASVMTEECMQEQSFDHVILGEGEKALYNLYISPENKRIIQGEPFIDLDEIPLIDRDIFGNKEASIYPSGLPKPFATFIASRGCPYNCSFCQPAEKLLFGKKVRSRSPENLIDDIENCIQTLNIKSFLIHDDCLLCDKAWIHAFINQLAQRKIYLPFAIQTRADLICKFPELITKLREQGLSLVLIGFESGSQDILDFLHKGTTVEQNLKAARICRENDVAIWANYMFGIPGESSDDVNRTVSMIQKINPAVHSPSFFTPYPGSYLYQYCQEKDLSLIEKYQDYRRNPSGKKIRGVDYTFLRKAVQRSKNINSAQVLLFTLRSLVYRSALMLRRLFLCSIRNIFR